MRAPLVQHLRWLIALRLLAITSVSVPYALWTLLEEKESRAEGFNLFAGGVYLASLGYIVLGRLLRGRTVLQTYLQLAGDVLLVTGLLYLYGGVSSPFSMLYLVLIAVAASMLGRSGALIIAGFAYALYATLGLALYFHALPPSTVALPSDAPMSLLIYNLGTHLMGFLAVALLTAYLAERAVTTEERLAQETESLATLELEHRDVVESMTSGLLTTDLNGIILSVNRSGLEILGDGGRSPVGRDVATLGLLSPASFSALRSGAAEERSSEQARTNFEVERTVSGGRQVLGLSLAPLYDAQGLQRGFLLTFRDLTELRRLQDELRMRDRMAAVGELAAGLAHEIGNPLAAISGSVQLLSSQARHDAGQRRLLEIVLKESQRLDRTIQGFLRFARPRDRSVVSFDIARLLAENVALLRNSPELLPSHRFESRLDPASFEIRADPDQISQIFWNLVRNALKAMPAGGSLAVEGSIVANAYRLRVRDSGTGMTSAEKADLFQPFRAGHARHGGMGMAIVYRIVTEHGGSITVDSEPGVGTTILVDLPLSILAPQPAGTPLPSSSVPVQG
jgi:two-component system sensor histidine kinase PilS (NtrC family)